MIRYSGNLRNGVTSISQSLRSVAVRFHRGAACGIACLLVLLDLLDPRDCEGMVIGGVSYHCVDGV